MPGVTAGLYRPKSKVLEAASHRLEEYNSAGLGAQPQNFLGGVYAFDCCSSSNRSTGAYDVGSSTDQNFRDSAVWQARRRTCVGRRRPAQSFTDDLQRQMYVDQADENRRHPN